MTRQSQLMLMVVSDDGGLIQANTNRPGDDNRGSDCSKFVYMTCGGGGPSTSTDTHQDEEVAPVWAITQESALFNGGLSAGSGINAATYDPPTSDDPVALTWNRIR